MLCNLFLIIYLHIIGMNNNQEGGAATLSPAEFVMYKNNNGITTSQNNGGVFPLTDIISEIDVDCYTDFDLARELTIDIDGQIKSDEIIFNSRILCNRIWVSHISKSYN